MLFCKKDFTVCFFQLAKRANVMLFCNRAVLRNEMQCKIQSRSYNPSDSAQICLCGIFESFTQSYNPSNQNAEKTILEAFKSVRHFVQKAINEITIILFT